MREGNPAALADAVAAALRGERDRREAALLAVLTPAVLAIAPGGAAAAETELSVTVLVRPGGEAALEAALERLPAEQAEDAAIDMRGPLPPLSFAAVRLAAAAPDAIAAAWHLLDLPGHVDMPGLHRQWRLCAAARHPDRAATGNGQAGNGEAGALSDVTDAYHLLRGLLREPAGGGGGGESCTLPGLLRRAGPRLIVPAAMPAHTLVPGPIAGPTLEPVLEALS